MRASSTRAEEKESCGKLSRRLALQDAPIGAAMRARWTDGLLVHLHSPRDAGNLDAGFVVSRLDVPPRRSSAGGQL